MYDAIIYIYNQGLRDYKTPLLELIGVLREALNSKKQLTRKYLIVTFWSWQLCFVV